MRIAVIGSGISGLVCARLLSRNNEITVFEADSHVGGHVNTVSVDLDGSPYRIDTGFIVYNERTYPQFTRILSDLQVATQPTSMSFSVRCDRAGIEFNGTSLNGLFAQRRNIVRPSFLRMLREIARFNREGADDFITVAEDETVGDYLVNRGYSHRFSDQYLLPMGAAIWSCPYDDFLRFPIRFILEFYLNHGLLSLRDRPVWRVVSGGSQEYVRKLVEPFQDRIRLECPVQTVKREISGVRLLYAGGVESFDEVIFACHSDQALKLLADPDPTEREILSQFPYGRNSAVLHTDFSVLPKRRRAWASWNYHLGEHRASRPTVTYHMNRLQQIHSKHEFLLTLNEDELINPNKVLARMQYTHPLFTAQRSVVQQRHSEVIRRHRTSFCGAYWRNGFHEDGVVSALAVCRGFGISRWNVDAVDSASSMNIHANRTDRSHAVGHPVSLVGLTENGV